MKRSFLILSVGILSFSFLSCSSPYRQPNVGTNSGVVAGGLIGAAVGALFGEHKGKELEGAAIGGAVGAAAGGLLGKEAEKRREAPPYSGYQQKKPTRGYQHPDPYYRPSQGAYRY